MLREYIHKGLVVHTTYTEKENIIGTVVSIQIQTVTIRESNGRESQHSMLCIDRY